MWMQMRQSFYRFCAMSGSVILFFWRILPVGLHLLGLGNIDEGKSFEIKE